MRVAPRLERRSAASGRQGGILTAAHLIAYDWVATVVVTIALAAHRRVPIVNAFGWIDSSPGLYFSAAVLAVVCGLAVLQLASDQPA